jgi:hypothetical protein
MRDGNVLVVEDDDTIRRLLIESLKLDLDGLAACVEGLLRGEDLLARV